MKKNLIIFGTGQMGEVAHYYFTHDSGYKVVAFAVSKDLIDQDSLLDVPVIPFEDIEKTYPPTENDMFVAIGPSQLNKTREKFYLLSKGLGYNLPSYICSKSVNWIEKGVGENCFILENQTIQPFVKIGNNVVIWSGNHIGHHSSIGDHCFITSHVVISGGVVIEPYCFLGVNATLRDHITIKKNCIIGAGAMIMKDTIENAVYVGETAKLFSEDSSKIRL